MPEIDTLIIGAGAAGLAAGLFLARERRGHSLVLLEGARSPGAKILVSGGARCNVTNREVSERDFWGGRPAIIRRVLRAFGVQQTIAFFDEIGVPLHEEAGGKLFPNSNRSRDVLNALLRAAADAGVRLLTDHRVVALDRADAGFVITTSQGSMSAARVVMATGGRSLPKSGSDGFGLDCAARLGHTIVPTTPALVPLLLDARPEGRAYVQNAHAPLSGVSHDAELTIWIDNRVSLRLRGSMLWTHFGISGPVALNMSRHWLRAELESRHVRLTASFVPGATFESHEAWWTEVSRTRPQASLVTLLSTVVPASLATAILSRLEIDPARTLAHLTRDDRRRLVRALTEWPLAVSGSRGYTFAEATAGGVSLDEIHPSTMESRVCPGLYLIGEMLDVDGRIGGFNFQWAWSSAFVAARALSGSRRLSCPP